MRDVAQPPLHERVHRSRPARTRAAAARPRPGSARARGVGGHLHLLLGAEVSEQPALAHAGAATARRPMVRPSRPSTDARSAAVSRIDARGSLRPRAAAPCSSLVSSNSVATSKKLARSCANLKHDRSLTKEPSNARSSDRGRRPHTHRPRQARTGPDRGRLTASISSATTAVAAFALDDFERIDSDAGRRRPGRRAGDHHPLRRSGRGLPSWCRVTVDRQCGSSERARTSALRASWPAPTTS